jgi:transglutaminase-like putative cysteine protease
MFMRHLLTITLVLCLSSIGKGQDEKIKLGQVTYRELDMKRYDKDTSAVAVVLDEFGKAYIDDQNDHNIIFEYYAKIKILKGAGTSYGDYVIPLGKSEKRTEKLISVKASSFNMENGSMKELKLDPKNIFTSDPGRYYDLKKFAIPNVRAGTVIEVFYKLESPFISNFRTWEFQSDIPKVKSEFWSIIPGYYLYNIALKGFQKLSKQENTIIRGCINIGGSKADCSKFQFAMVDIPAFIEEDYMTAKSNFLSSVNFELAQINYPDGRKDMITKEWKDADQEMQRSQYFGLQIKRGKDIVDREVEQLVSGETDPLQKAMKIYEFIKGRFRWNEYEGKYSDFGIKKAFESKIGNVGDINLSLIAALEYAGLNVEPLLLSTREHGTATELYPVLTDFNYVVAKVNIGDKVYLLDATDRYHPFGLLPQRCLNGKGRVLGDKGSYWYDVKPTQKEKKITVVSLALDGKGLMKGSLDFTYAGYAAMSFRKRVNEFSSEKEYIENYAKGLHGISIKKFEFKNLDQLQNPVVLRMDIEFDADTDLGSDHFLFNPFVLDGLKENPFKSNARLYPVDFGAPVEETMILNLEYPTNYAIDGLPPKLALSLPQGGGRYLFEVQNTANKLTMNNSLLIAKPLFTSSEYHYLKELFNQVISAQQTELVFKKTK